MATSAATLIFVFLISASPIGETLIAVRVGAALGMEPGHAFTVAYPANSVPALIILPSLDYSDKKHPRFFNYFAKREGRLGSGLRGKHVSVILFAWYRSLESIVPRLPQSSLG